MRFSLKDTPVIDRGNGSKAQIFCDKDTNPELPASILLSTRPAHAGFAPAHKHEVETELFIGVEGHGVVAIDGVEFPLNPGDAVFALPGTLHSVGNDSDEPLTFYAIFMPGCSLQMIRDSAVKVQK